METLNRILTHVFQSTLFYSVFFWGGGGITTYNLMFNKLQSNITDFKKATGAQRLGARATVMATKLGEL